MSTIRPIEPTSVRPDAVASTSQAPTLLSRISSCFATLCCIPPSNMHEQVISPKRRPAYLPTSSEKRPNDTTAMWEGSSALEPLYRQNAGTISPTGLTSHRPIFKAT